MARPERTEEIDGIERLLMQLRIEKEALKKETEPGAKERLSTIEKELKELNGRNQQLREQCLALHHRLPAPSGRRRLTSDP